MSNNISQMIKTLARQGQVPETIICTVTDVDTDARTVDCSPIDESAPILGVNLQANQGLASGIVLFPKVGSFVIVSMMHGGMGGCVIATEEVEKAEVVIGETRVEVTEDGVVLNGGELGGLVKVEALTERLNGIEKSINQMKAALSGWVPVPQDGGAALKGAISGWASETLVLTQRGDYENEKVKQ